GSHFRSRVSANAESSAGVGIDAGLSFIEPRCFDPLLHSVSLANCYRAIGNGAAAGAGWMHRGGAHRSPTRPASGPCASTNRAHVGPLINSLREICGPHFARDGAPNPVGY